MPGKVKRIGVAPGVFGLFFLYGIFQHGVIPREKSFFPFEDQRKYCIVRIRSSPTGRIGSPGIGKVIHFCHNMQTAEMSPSERLQTSALIS